MERLWSVVIREPAGVVIKSDTFSLGGWGGGRAVGFEKGVERSISAKVLRRGDYPLKCCDEKKKVEEVDKSTVVRPALR